MKRLGLRPVLVFCLLLFLVAWRADAAPQEHAPPAPQSTPSSAKSADYSKEPFVIERISTKCVFESDGTSSQERAVRVRIQSQAGLETFGLLRFQYASAVATMEITSLRVRKPDGRVVPTPAENILDMPADITRQAPFYSDLKEKQAAVKGLEVGDIVEIESRKHVHSPLAPGQFWYEYNFFSEGIALREELKISVPRDRYVQVRSPKMQPTVTEQGSYLVYSWQTANLESKSEKKKPASASRKEPEPPSVQITTFHSWEEVGNWFQGLVTPRVVPTPEIRAKAEELTRGATNHAQKIQAVYNYVSTKFRYIGVAFGIGRYQPHTATEVLANGYGDCKDKHTLLAALLAAAGIKVYPALINSNAKIDQEVPSPGQFDHMIGAVPQGGDFLWLDTTAEVAPVGYLIPALREKKALVIAENGSARLVETPADPPVKNSMRFNMEGTLDDAGTFEGKADLAAHGDLELVLRAALRSVGQPQWKDVMQSVSASLGFGGTVSDVAASAPDSTESPIQISYHYTRKEYGDWPNRRIVTALPYLALPEAPAESEKEPEPIELGSPEEVTLQGTMALPKESSPQPPPGLDLQEAFASYHSTYSFSDGKLKAERLLVTKMRKIPPAQFEAYRKFRKAIVEEERAFISLNGGGIIGGAGGPEGPHRIRVSVGVQEAKIVNRVDPVYPPLARQARIQGTVRLHVIIAKDGTIEEIEFVSGPPLLVQAAMEAVKQWRYEPTLLSDEPVEVETYIDVIFTLAW